jgi:hypothetical protein
LITADPQVFLTTPGLATGKQSTSFNTPQAHHIKDGLSLKGNRFSKINAKVSSSFESAPPP